MADARMEPLSAFVDGEETDLQDVVRLLGEPEGVELLRDMLRLRLIARDPGAAASQGTNVRQPWRAAVHTSPGRWRWAAAALFAGIVGLGVGIVVPRAGDDDATAPPRADRTVRFTPGVDWVTGR